MKRKMFDAVYAHLYAKQYTILTGARQVGKTTLLKHMEEQLKTERYQVFFISFEDIEILNAINKHPENIFHYVPKPEKKTGLRSQKRIYLLIDEIQYAKNPSNFLKYLFDTYGESLKIVATGSSAFYIDRKFRDSLAGRKRLFELYTLDFEEFLDFKKYSELKPELERMRKRAAYQSLRKKTLQQLFDEYLVFGGYPAVVLAKSESEKKLLLSELVNTYLKRDVMESSVSDEFKFFQLVKILAGQTGGLLNQHELANTLRVAYGTVDNYLYTLRKCFHVYLVRPHYGNIRKEFSKMPKFYFNDLGFRNTLLNYFEKPVNRLDKGALLENYAFIRLRQLYGTDEIRFWRTTAGHEVDFVVSTTYRKGAAVEVKFSESELRVKNYKSFVETYPSFKLRFSCYQPSVSKNWILRM